MSSSYWKDYSRFLLVSMAILGAIAIYHRLYQQCSTTEKLPKAFVSNTSLDLGVVRQSETREVAFPIENKGLRRLILNEIGCGCGTPARPTIVVPPGQTRDIPVSLDLMMHLGAFEKKVTFSTNDTTYPCIELKVVAKVIDL